MAYKSRIDLKLGRIPEVTDNELYPVFQQVYNAIHTLNSYMDQTVDIVSSPSQDTLNSTSFSFRMQSFWAPMETDSKIEKGNPVSMGNTGFVRGPFGITIITGGYPITGPFGIALDIDTLTNKVLIGWPPAIIDIPGALYGDTLYAKKGTGTYLAKNLADGLPGDEFWPIGKAIADGQALLLPNLIRYKTV